MAMMLLNENATVTICHSRTQDLESIVKQADIIVECSWNSTIYKIKLDKR